MFSNPKARFIFQLICSIITLPLGFMLIIAILEGMFGVNVSAIYDFLESSAIGSLSSQLSRKSTDILFVVFLVIHILAFIGSGGVKCSFKLYAGAVKGAFLFPVAILNIFLGVIVAVVGLFFIVALAPIFAFFSTIKNYIESKILEY